MWNPPDKVKHAIPAGGWPTRERAASSRWFSPIRFGHQEAKQRTWVPAMVPWRASDDGVHSADGAAAVAQGPEGPV